MQSITMKDSSIGRTEDGRRVAAEFRVAPAQLRVTGKTINHEPIPEGALEFSASGLVWDKGARRYHPCQAGQCLDVLLEVTRFTAPWTKAAVESLHAIWTRWHLNGLKAACVHQTEIVYEDTPYGRRVDLDATTAANTCPEGYRYGSAWLYEPLPEDVLTELHRLALLGSMDALIKSRGYDLAGKAV